jgi:ABC-2 type transport system ATP-binding protein
MSVVQVRNLRKNYNSLVAVDSISFEVVEGEIFGIVGPNGAGKTTTVEMIEGIRPIDSGEVKVLGINTKKEPRKVKSMIGVQLQEGSFYDRLTVWETLDLLRSFYQKARNLKDVLALTGLEEKKNALVSKLSGGQKQRLALAAALVCDPPVLFLDEPTTGLDPQARRHTWGLINQIKEERKTIILTTHYMEEAEELCDRVAIMDYGKIIALDTPTNLIKKLLAKGFTKKIIKKEANLEDVFLNLTGHRLRE